MDIRRYTETDIHPIVSLFYETVHSVNAKDYSTEQLHAWAPVDEIDARLTSWKQSLRHNIAYVAEINGQIVGFSDMTHHGHLDRLFTHKDFQGQGIASALVTMLESEARKLGITEMDTDASITAKPFFERHGFQVLKSQSVERRNVKLMNYKMVKKLAANTL